MTKVKLQMRWALVFAALLGCCCGCDRSTTSPQQESPTSVVGTSKPAPKAHSDQPKWFADVTPNSGINAVYHSGRKAQRFTILESVGGGVGMLDVDLDHDIDLFFPSGGDIATDGNEITGLPHRLFRNEGDGRFTEISAAAQIEGLKTDYSHGVTVADFNADGFPDVLVTCLGRNQLLLNDGCGAFLDVTATAGLTGNAWHTAAAWADADKDGLPDVYIAAYLDWSLATDVTCLAADQKTRDVCPPQRFNAAQDRVFRNMGDGSFEEMTSIASLRSDGKGLGVVAADVNDDGWPDFYVANDEVANHLYLGGPDFRWREVGVASGVALDEFGAAEGSMGVDYCDYDGDGRGDLWVTNFEFEDNSLYRNLGQSLFMHATVRTGLGGSSRKNVGFGTGWFDLDGDGWLEPFVINGHVVYHSVTNSYQQPAVLYRSQAGKRFSDVTSAAGDGFARPRAGRGAAIGDLDLDGALDLVITEQDEPATVLRNQHSIPHWLRLKLVGVNCNRDALGTRVTIDFQGRKLVRWITSGSGYLSQFDSTVWFPVENDNPVDVVVDWPDGAHEVFAKLTPNRSHVVAQGHGTKTSLETR